MWQTVKKYLELLQSVANRRERVVEIELDDVFSHFGGDEMAEKIRKNTYRYKQLIGDAIDRCMPEPEDGMLGEPDIADVLMSSRNRATGAAEPSGPGDPNQLPPGLKRRYEIRVLPRTKEKAMPLRKVKAGQIGSLVTLKGIVTRVSEVKPNIEIATPTPTLTPTPTPNQVKPNIEIATYTCQKGGAEVYQEVVKRDFMPLFTCPPCAPTLALPLPLLLPLTPDPNPNPTERDAFDPHP